MNTVQRLACAIGAVLLVAVQVTAAPLPATAGDGGRILFDMPGDGQGFVPDPAKPLVTSHRLAPGSSGFGDVELKNDSRQPIDIFLEATAIVDDENGCLHQETRDGDTTCGEADGELGEWLRITLTEDAESRSPRQIWTGSISDLQAGAALDHDIPAGAVRSLRMTVHLPRAAGNDSMTDQLGFGLRWTATADTGESTADVPGTVLGTSATAPPATGPGTQLPFTGTTLAVGHLSLGVALLLAGVALIVVSRQRREAPMLDHA